MVEIEKKHYEEIKATEDDCSLKDFIKRNHKEYERGCAYYEYTDREEIIDLEVLLMNKVSPKLYTMEHFLIASIY